MHCVYMCIYVCVVYMCIYVCVCAQDWLLKRWDKYINEDERRIYQRWVEKIKGTRTQFEKDEEFITQHRIKRIKNPRERIRNNISTQNKNTNSNEAIPDIRDSRTSSSRCEDQSKNMNTSTHRFNLRSSIYQNDH